MKMAMPNSDYWKKREDEERKWQKKNIASDEAFNRLIERYYNQAISQINKEIDHQYQSLAKSVGGLRNAYSTVDMTDIADYEAEAQKLVMQAAQMRAQGKKVTYDSFSDDVNRRMKIYNATMRINRLEYLKSQVGLHLTEANMNIENATRLKLTDSYINEVKRQAGILGRNLKFNNALIEDDNVAKIIMAQTAGANWSQRLWLNQDALKAQLDTILSTGLITGQSNQAMARQLRNQIKTTIKNHGYVAERLVRTETARVQYQAQIDSIKAADYRYVKWYAEPGACRVCQRINDNDEYDLGYGVFPVDEVPQIPIHPNCRCSISAYWVEGKDNLGKNSSKKTSESSDKDNFQKLMDTDITKLKKDDIEYLGKAINEKYHIDRMLGDKDGIAKIIANYRQVGGTVKKSQWMPRSNASVKKALNEAFNHYPSDWVNYLNNGEFMYAGKNQRGFYARHYVDSRGRFKAPSTVKTQSDIPKYLQDDKAGKYNTIFSSGRPTTAWHELGHFVETHNEDVERIEREFLKERTKGEQTSRLYDIYNGSVDYRLSEITKKDNFINPYIGKEYPKGTEVLSIGLESLFEPGKGQLKSIGKDGKNKYVKINEDKEYLNLILGLLLKG